MSTTQKQVVRPEAMPKTEQILTQEFIDKYNSLCKEYGLQIIVTPAFKARDDGTWSFVLQTSIGRLPTQETN